MESIHRSNDLQYYHPISITLKECIDYHTSKNYYDQNFIEDLKYDKLCTENPTNKALGYGDEGDPLVFDGTLIGIVSSGCNNNDKSPGIHTKVFSYIDWIMRKGTVNISKT